MQVTCGVELALLLIEAYVTDGVPSDQASVQRILRIFAALKAENSSASQPSPREAGSGGADTSEGPLDAAASRIATAAIKWARKATPATTSSSNPTVGSEASGPEPGNAALANANEAVELLHRAYAHWLTARHGPEGLANAVLHYTRGNDIEGLANALDAAAVGAPMEEQYLFLVRAVLQVSPPC